MPGHKELRTDSNTRSTIPMAAPQWKGQAPGRGAPQKIWWLLRVGDTHIIPHCFFFAESQWFLGTRNFKKHLKCYKVVLETYVVHFEEGLGSITTNFGFFVERCIERKHRELTDSHVIHFLWFLSTNTYNIVVACSFLGTYDWAITSGLKQNRRCNFASCTKLTVVTLKSFYWFRSMEWFLMGQIQFGFEPIILVGKKRNSLVSASPIFPTKAIHCHI